MLSPRLVASLTMVVGLSMIAGWITAFRNRGYLGWLGLAFLSLSAYLMFRDRAITAHDVGLPNRGLAVTATVLFSACVVFFLLALVAAAQETARRIREIQSGHRAAEEALMAMVQGSKDQQEGEDKPEGHEDESSRGSGDG